MEEKLEIDFVRIKSMFSCKKIEYIKIGLFRTTFKSKVGQVTDSKERKLYKLKDFFIVYSYSYNNIKNNLDSCKAAILQFIRKEKQLIKYH